jgi:peptidyl-prolyl cis-trans isomerase C
MKNFLRILMVSSAFVAVAQAETVFVDGKPVSQAVIDQAMAQLKKNPMAAQQLSNPQFKQEMLNSIGMQQAILADGNAQGLDKSAAYQAKLNEIKPMIYAQIMQEKANAQPITDAQIKAKYDQMKADAAKQQQYDVSHILVKDQKTANDIEAQLKKGAKFADLAKKYSIDPGSKANGGELGWSDGSNYVPEFTAAIKTLKKGQYTTTPVKSQFGYHIIKLNDVKSGGTAFPAYDKMKDQIKQQIQMERTKAFFDGIKAKHKVEVK